MEQASTSVYAQGGRGNARLIAWQGDKTLTFTVTDALISPVSLSMLSGAGLVKEANKKVHVHAVTAATMKISGNDGIIDLTEALKDFGTMTASSASPLGSDGGIYVDAGTDAPIFIMETEADGSITGKVVVAGTSQDSPKKDITFAVPSSGDNANKGILTIPSPTWSGGTAINKSINVLVDYYIVKNSEKVSEIQLTAQDFAGYYYVEADTLFRSQATGIDMPANLTFPNVKVQSGFTISMAGTGDPSELMRLAA